MRRIVWLALLAVVSCSDSGGDTPGICGPLNPCPLNELCVQGVCVADLGTADAPVGTADARVPDGSPGVANLTVDVSEHDFGMEVLGQTGQSVTFTVTNRGTATSLPIDIMLVGSRAASYVLDVQSACDGATLAPGASCTVNVTFRPDAAGDDEAMLSVGGLTITLHGQGLPPGQLTLSPPGADFGQAVVGQMSDPQSFTVRNAGGAPTGEVAVSIVGAGAGQFLIDSDGCSGHALDAMATCTVALRMKPTSVGSATASLSVTAAPGGSQTAMLVGRGLAPVALAVDTSALDLGTSIVGSTTVDGTIDVTNQGGVATAALTTHLAGSSELTIESDGCDGKTLAAGASCAIKVQARPTSAGQKTATLTITAGDATATATITTKAVPPGALAIAPEQQDFDPALLGTDGESFSFTVTNTGGAATGTLATRVTGSGGDQFVVDTNLCNGKILAPHGICTVTVIYRPTTRGAVSASLEVSSDPGGTATSALSATGQLQATLSGDASTMAFGTVDVTQTGLAQVWTLTNGGDVPTGVLSTTLDGDAGDFTVDNACGADPLEPGASCTLTVAFAPTSGGMKSLNATVTGDPGGSVSLMAQGTGRPPQLLTVARSGNGSGSVGSTPGGITCGASCMASYLYGTSVTLTATPDTGSDFAGWMGACSGQGACIVAMTDAENVTAAFALERIPLNVTVNGSGHVDATPAGAACASGTCSSTFDYGTPVALTAVPARGFAFSGWTGCTSTSGANGATCNLTLHQATSVAATFAPIQVAVTVDVTGTGTVTSTPAGVACTGHCPTSFAFGTQVTLTAMPGAHQHFTGWTGACSGTGGCSFTVDTAPIAVGAGFAIDSTLLTVTPATGGTITSVPGGINCGTACTASFAFGTPVTLTAMPAPGFRFDVWTGDCSGSTCALTMDAAHGVSARFVQQFAVTVTRPTGGTVTGPGGLNCGTAGNACVSTPLDTGTAVSLQATPDSGFRVGTWTGCTPGANNRCTLTLNGATTVTQAFVGQFTVTVTRPTGGTVTGAGGINCGTGGTACVSSPFDGGTSVTLTAIPDGGFRVGTWGGCTPGVNSTCSLNSGATVTQAFVRQFTVTVTKPTGGTVTGPGGINCGTNGTACVSAPLDSGSAVHLVAAPDSGFRLGTWTGCTPGTNSDCNLTLNAAATVTVSFTRLIQLTWSTPGGGTLTPSPAGTSCGTGCALYAAGTPVTLTAAPGSGGTIGRWGGDCANAQGTTCSLTMSTPQSGSVVFQYLLEVDVNGGGDVTTTNFDCAQDCTQRYDFGTVLTLQQQPFTNWIFDNWGGACSGTSCTVTMNGPVTVSANYHLTNFTVTVSAGAGGSVITTANGTAVDCSAGCSFPAGTAVSVEATATTPFWSFSQWSGSGGPSGSSGTIFLNGNVSIQAQFAAQQAILIGAAAGPNVTTGPGSMTATGTGSSNSAQPQNPASISCNADTLSCGFGIGVNFDVGSEVTVTAIVDPQAGLDAHHLSSWTGIGARVPNTIFTYLISSFGTSSQGINWQICTGIFPRRICRWANVDPLGNRKDLPVPYAVDNVNDVVVAFFITTTG